MNTQAKIDECGRMEIDSWEEVPDFKNETEEQAWWDEHTPGEQLLEQFKRVPVEGDETLPTARQTTQPKIQYIENLES